MSYKIIDYDPYLRPFEGDLNLRMDNYRNVRASLVGEGGNLVDFANGYKYFGFHKEGAGWYYREWAPGAQEMYLTGDFCDWNPRKHRMDKIGNGCFEIYLPGENALYDGCRVQAVIIHDGQELRRIPSYATRVVMEPGTIQWNAVIHEPAKPFKWTDGKFKGAKTPLIYECHIGMAQNKLDIGSYEEFTKNTLPRIKELGYNTIQIMAVMEHPYYASFGYQVTNFFAASSRFGTPEELKKLINTAHRMGIRVLLDVVHSHCAKNTAEGLNMFDGTDYQYFHSGPKGEHREWDTKCFNYGKHEVIHFLLSNLKFWMDEYHFDGFRFDGVTSMLYHDHALGTSFDCYDKYFSMNTDTEAVTYLQLANEVIHGFKPEALTIAEDMSAMPGMCIPIEEGGIGFDYRLGMGIPPMWIRLLDKTRDEDWDIWGIWYELSGRRPMEKVIGYVECHDQALVGDKTVMFRLCDKEMYWSMSKDSQNMIVDRGVALHKMIRWVTHCAGGDGYLNFMGNEFGHPEWIDFPREGNGWSYHYCRRRWDLVDNKELKYEWLNEFDKAMIKLTVDNDLLCKELRNLWVHQDDKVLVFERGPVTLAFNFHPSKSFTGYFIPVSRPGKYKVVLSTDEARFGGQDRIDENIVYDTVTLGDGRTGFLIYMPSRTAFAVKKID